MPIENFISNSGMSSAKKNKAKKFYSEYYQQTENRKASEDYLSSAEKNGTQDEKPYVEKNSESGFSYTSIGRLNTLDNWLVKHGEIDNHARRTVAEFIVKKDDEKKAVWYIIQNEKYNNFNENDLNTAVTNYDPDIEGIKKKLRRGKWERLRTFNSDNLYWGKLGSAVQTARPWVFERREKEAFEEKIREKKDSIIELSRNRDIGMQERFSLIKEQLGPMWEYQKQLKKTLMNKLLAADGNNVELEAIRAKLKNHVSQLGEEPEKELISDTETLVLRLGQIMGKSGDSKFLASDEGGFMVAPEDFSYDAGDYTSVVNTAGQVDNLLTVTLAVYSFCKAIAPLKEMGFKKGIKQIGINTWHGIKNVPSFLATLNNQAVNASSAWSFCEAIKAGVVDNEGFRDIIAASKNICATVDKVLGWATTIGSGLNTISKTAKLVTHKNQKEHADNSGYLLNDRSSKYIRDISKAASGLKSDQVKEDSVGTVSSALTTTAGVFGLTGVGFGLGLVFSFAGAVGAFATWIAGIHNRSKRKKHLIDTYLGINEIEEKRRHQLRKICEAKLSIVDDERMADYILAKYSRYLYNKVFLGNGKKFLIRNMQGYQEKKYVPGQYYDQKENAIRAEKENRGTSLQNDQLPSNETPDEIRERYAAYEILKAYGVKPAISEDGVQLPGTTEAVIRRKLSV